MLDHDLDIDDLIEELKIKKEAIRHGRLNQPPADATEFDVPQRDIVRRMTELLGQAQRDRREHLDRQSTRRDEIEREMAAMRLEEIPKDAEAAIERVENEHRPSLVQAREQERRMMRELRAFRADNECMHEPSYPESFILHWAVVGLILFAESGANSYFFAKGSDLGLLGGLFQALLISLLNVVPALLIGSKVVPLLRHVSGGYRVVARVSGGVYLIVLLAFNLAVAHYREVLESDPLTAIILAIPNLIQDPLGIDNLDAWVLFGLGNVFAVIAVIKAYNADDPYPGYGRVHRAYKAAEHEYQTRREAIPKAINSVIDTHRNRVDYMIATGQAHVREYGDLIARSQGVHQDYVHHAQAIEEGCNQLLTSYRIQNAEIRTENCPTYWQEAFSFGERANLPPPDLNEEQNNLESFDQAVKNMRSKVGETLEALRELNKGKLKSTEDFFAEIEAEADRRLQQQASEQQAEPEAAPA